MALDLATLCDDIYFGFCAAISARLAISLEGLGYDLFLELDYLLYSVVFLSDKTVLFVFYQNSVDNCLLLRADWAALALVHKIL